jgi:hypothetical protein
MAKTVLGSSWSTVHIGSSDTPLFSPNGRLYLRHQVETIQRTSGGLAATTASKWGITLVTNNHVTSLTSGDVLYLAPPETGFEKTVVYGSTAANTSPLIIETGAARIDGLAANGRIQFSTLGTAYQSVTLIGLSTSLWAVKACASTVGNFGAATGIRAIST